MNYAHSPEPILTALNGSSYFAHQIDIRKLSSSSRSILNMLGNNLKALPNDIHDYS